MLYTCKNFFKHVRPGAVRVQANDDNPDIMATAFKDEKRGSVVSVLINKGNAPLTAYLTGENLPPSFQVYQTTRIKNFGDMGIIDSLVILPERSVTTLVYEGNKSPTIEPVADQAILMNAGEQVISLERISPGFGESSQSLSSFTAVSSNPSLIPNPGLSTVGEDGTASLTYQPETDQTGSAKITLTLTDDTGSEYGYSTKSISFSVNVYSNINEKPTLSPITDQYLLEDNEAQEVALTGLSDGDDGSQELTVTIQNTNTSLLNAEYLSASQAIKLTPLENQNGQAEISVTVTDNGGNANNNGNQSVTRYFMVQVSPVNDAPVMDQVSDQTITVDSVLRIEVTGIDNGDPETQRMILSATSDNTGILPDPTVSYSGTDIASLTLEPIKAGTATIALELKDDGGQANFGKNLYAANFDVTVIPGTNIANSKEEHVKIYPNPTNDFLMLHYPSSEARKDARIYNETGSLVKQFTLAPGTSSYRLNVDKLANGIYLLYMDKEGTISLQKFIKK